MAEALALAGASWAMSMTRWVASPIISKLLTEGFACLGIDMAARIDKLEATILPQFQDVIDAAERSEHKSNLDKWLRRLKEAMYEAEDAVDLYKYRVLQQKVESGGNTMKKISDKLSSSLSILSSEKIKLRKCLNKLESIAFEAKEFRDLFGKQPKSNPNNSIKEPMVTTSKPPLRIFGREVDCEHLLQELLEPVSSEFESGTFRSYSVHSIVGVGGAGKTTLAQLVYNDQRVTAEFDLRIWLSMTRGLDLYRDTRRMVEAASRKPCQHFDNLDILQEVLIDFIRSKKILVVMDDVWWNETMNEFNWEQFVAPLASVKKGSRILVTSRTDKMPHVLLPQKIMPLKELDKNYFLSLFMHHAFGGMEIDGSHSLERLERIGKQIANKLNRSPLAAKTVGSRLFKNLNETFWQETLERDVLNDTMQSLLWSYQNLDAVVQRCFSFCSIFPEGYNFRKEDVIRLWVAEGFIQDSGTRRMEDVGEDYFQELLSVYFFQIEDDWFSQKTYGMHDLFHDLAKRVSKDECFRIEDGQAENIAPTVCHLSVIGESFNNYRPSIEKLKNLRTVIFLKPVSGNVACSFLKEVGKFKKLRVLGILSGSSVQDVPDTIGELMHLRYLDLSFTMVKKLPGSVEKLYNLQTLIVKRLVNPLPKGINKLSNLRNLVCEGLPARVGRLTSLQKLDEFEVKKKKGFEIGELKNLNEIRGSITIRNLKNIEGREEAAEAKMEHKKHVDSLSLIWGYDSSLPEDSSSHLGVLECLKPHANLKHLKIIYYKSSAYPSWMLQPGCLENLTSLILSECPFLEYLPPASTLFSSLCTLSLHDLPKLTHLPVFPPSLKTLYITKCLSLLFISEQELQEGNSKEKLLMVLENSQFKVLLETIPDMSIPVRHKLLEECLELQRLMECDNHCRTKDVDMLVMNLQITDHLPGGGCIWDAFFLFLELTMDYIYSKSGQYPLVLPSGLETMSIDYCYITNDALSRCLVQLTGLKFLSLVGIRTITALPPKEVLCQMVALNELRIAENNFLISIASVHALASLKTLLIRDCPCLGLPGEEGRVSFPASLESLQIINCYTVTHFRNMYLPSLSYVTFENCRQLKSIVLSNITSLQKLWIISCPDLYELIFSDVPISIKSLTLFNSSNVETYCTSGILSWPSLMKIEMNSFTMLNKLLLRSELAMLQDIEIANSSETFFDEDEFGCLNSLRHFILRSCKIQALPCTTKNHSSLIWLELWNCLELLSLPDMPETLKYLLLENCPAIALLPNMPKSLGTLLISGCPYLKNRCQEPDGEDWPKISHVRWRDIE